MLDPIPRFSPEFLDRKRQLLIQLQNRLHDPLEANDSVVGGTIVKMARVERALEKIAEGSYGLSDVSGEPIPEDRLEAMPYAINTVTEQNRIEVPG